MAVRRGILALPQIGRAQSRVPELNLLPDQFQRRLRLSPRSSLLLALAFEVLIAAALLRQESTLPRVQDLLTRVLGGQSEAERRTNNLQGNLARLEQDLNALRTGRQNIASRSTNWAALLARLSSSTPEGISVERVSQTGVNIVIQGLAPDLDRVNRFRSVLVSAQEISGATVVSIQQVPGRNFISFTVHVRLR